MLDPDRQPCIRGHGPSAARAAELLTGLGVDPVRRDGPAEPDPVLRWARSGAMWLSGEPGRAPRTGPAAVAARADGALAALRALAGERWSGPTDGAALLGERAAIAGLERRGAVSAGGACRLIETCDARLAVNLPRDDDLALVPAWLERDPGADPWTRIGEEARRWPAAELLERARLLGLAVAPVAAPGAASPPAAVLTRTGENLEQRSRSAPVVLDLSSLWAGPLCASLLGAAGARVIRLESSRRPDGARRGPAAFFDLLHAGQPSAALDLTCSDGVAALLRVLETVDVVVESARPRALEQLGVRAGDWLRAGAGRSWVSITGYGRPLPRGERIAFGDDAAAAAGLVAATAAADLPQVFCADAIADPLAGLHAAVAAAASWRQGGGHLIDVSLCGAASEALGPPATPDAAVRADGARGWQVHAPGGCAPVAAPRARRPAGRARALGVDTAAVLATC